MAEKKTVVPPEKLPEPDRLAFMEKYGATLFRGDSAWPPAKKDG